MDEMRAGELPIQRGARAGFQTGVSGIAAKRVGLFMVEACDLWQRVRGRLTRTDPVGRCVSTGLLFVLTYLLERALPYFAMFDHGWAVWWPTNGALLALMLASRREHWPYILLAVQGATALQEPVVPGSITFLLAAAVCNCIEVLIPAWMLPRFYTLDGWLQNPRLVWRFIVFATLLGPALSGLLMGGFFRLVVHQPFWPVVLRWGIADSVGIVMYTTLVLALISPQLYALFRGRRLAETLGIMALLLVTSWVAFIHSTSPMVFLISPVLLLVATRLGFIGSVVALNLLAPLVTLAALHGWGPFGLLTGAQEPRRIVMVQVFIVLSLLMTLPISVQKVQQESAESNLKRAYDQMAALATADGLTGLANRRRFDAALEAEWRRALRDGLPVSVLMLDADRFKAYNDRYGHPAGDACLQAIARAICNIPQRAGDLVARYGGEEFVILLPGVSEDGAYTVAEQVRYNVQKLNLDHEDNPAGRVTVSVGCASIVPRSEISPSDLLEGSDRALYLAKQTGRNRSCIHRIDAQGNAGALHNAPADVILEA